MEPSTPAAAAGGLRVEDGVVVGVYFLFVFAVGVWSSIRSKKRNLSGYFLASRSMHWIPIGASLFASNIGSGHFIGLAGTGAASGIAVAGFELSAMFWLVVLGWVFVPVYLAAGVYTMPEYLRLRLGGQRIRVYLSVLAILLYVFTKISVDLYAGALFIQRAMRWEGEWGLYTSIILLLLVAAAFTIFGGLTAVVWTDLAQTALMVAGACVLTALSFSAVGGYGAMIQQYFESLPSANVSAFDSDNRSCSTVRNDSMHLFRDPVNSDLPWPGMIFGMSIISLWYWCSDQVIVQRALAARSLAHAKAGTVLAALLKVLPLWLMVFPGMAARVLYKDRVACSDPDACWRLCRSRSGCSNLAYIELVVQLLPPGLSGMMLAVMLAALMSSLTSIFNSASTLFSIDIYKRIRTNATEVEQVIVGRVFVVVMVGISIVWVPIINNFSSDQLFVYIQSMQSYLPPPICAVYVLSVFWSRTTEPGAFCGLVLGLAVGVARFAMEFSFLKPACGSAAPDLRPGWVRRLVFDIHYLHFGPLLFALVCVVVVVVSLMTEPLPAECLHRLTFWTRHSRAERRPLPADGATDPAGGDGGAAKRQGDEPEGDEAPSGCRRALGVLCCISGAEADAESAAQSAADGRQTEQTEEQKAHADAAILHETRRQKIALNFAAVLVMTLSAVLYIYYR